MSVATVWPVMFACGHSEDKDLSFKADFEERVLEPARCLDRPSWWIDNREALGMDVPELVQSSVTDPRAASTENPL